MASKPLIVSVDPTSSNTDPTLGHCWPPSLGVPFPLVRKVFINGDKIPVVVGDVYFEHPDRCPNPPFNPPTGVAPHPLTTGNIVILPTAGSLTIFIEDKPIYLTGLTLSCGDAVNPPLGSPAYARNVWIEV